MKGSVLDFLKLAAEEPELAKQLVELASKYDFEFSDELTDDDLGTVSGGILPTNEQLREMGRLDDIVPMNQLLVESFSNFTEVIKKLNEMQQTTDDALQDGMKQ